MYYFGDTNCLMHKIKPRARLFTYLTSIVSFLNKSSKICPVKLKISILYHMSNTYRHLTFFRYLSLSLKWWWTFPEEKKSDKIRSKGTRAPVTVPFILISNGLMVRVLKYQSRVLVSKPLGGSKIDSAFYPSVVNQMGTKNYWGLSG